MPEPSMIVNRGGDPTLYGSISNIGQSSTVSSPRIGRHSRLVSAVIGNSRSADATVRERGQWRSGRTAIALLPVTVVDTATVVTLSAMPDVSISLVEPVDIGEVLTLQRAAYVTEAQLYGDSFLPPLTQTYDELALELAASIAVKATRGHRILGAARARIDGTILRVGRLTVAPDAQRHGIGSRLLVKLEQLAPATIETFTLFTGHLSEANIRLYQRLGYTETRRERLKPGVVLVHLDKPASTDGPVGGRP